MGLWPAPVGVSVLSVERSARQGDCWDGDLRHFWTQAWHDETTETAALVVARNGCAVCWLNLAHVTLADERLVWYRAQQAARYQPFAVLSRDDLAILHPEAVSEN